MKTKNGIQLMLSILMISGILITTVAANGTWPSLPTTPVDLTIINPPAIDYPFVIQLSEVPSGFDVTNGVYDGW